MPPGPSWVLLRKSTRLGPGVPRGHCDREFPVDSTRREHKSRIHMAAHLPSWAKADYWGWHGKPRHILVVPPGPWLPGLPGRHLTRMMTLQQRDRFHPGSAQPTDALCSGLEANVPPEPAPPWPCSQPPTVGLLLRAALNLFWDGCQESKAVNKNTVLLQPPSQPHTGQSR